MNRQEYLESMRAISAANRTMICQWCGIEFIMRSPSGKAMKGEVKEGLFCSIRCRWGAKSHECKTDICKIYIINCEVCGKPLTSRNKARIVCGTECAQEHARQRSFKRNSAKKKTKKICNECGKTFMSEYGDKGREFCSVGFIAEEAIRIDKERASMTLIMNTLIPQRCLNVMDGDVRYVASQRQRIGEGLSAAMRQR